MLKGIDGEVRAKSLNEIKFENIRNDIESIKKNIIELKQNQSDERLQLLTKEVQELKEMLKTVLK